MKGKVARALLLEVWFKGQHHLEAVRNENDGPHL